MGQPTKNMRFMG